MSEDEIRSRFPQLRLETVRRAKLRELTRAGKFGEAAALKEQLDGPLPRRQIVPLFSGRRLNILLERIERGMV